MYVLDKHIGMSNVRRAKFEADKI